ncbi:acyl carrier protein [Candidatus Sumerlaeota bacterium]|nr:acyl carrier protein [Candidatus Sumerlaeota bacterium]
MSLESQLKALLVEELNLEDVNPEEMEDDAPLFGEGLGLDSLDAVELVVLLKKHFSIDIKDMEEGRRAFQSIRSLADYVRARQGQP